MTDSSVPETHPPSDASPPTPSSPKNRPHLQTMANVLTSVVALAAILLSVWEGVENRRHNRLSVLPYLEPIEATYGSAAPIENEYFLLPSQADSLYAVSYALENSGLGPAVLNNIIVFRSGEKVFDAVQDAQRYTFDGIHSDLRQLPFDVDLLRNSYAAGDMLEAGDIHYFLTVAIPFSGVDTDTLSQYPPSVVRDEVLERRSFVFCYCSVYQEDCGMTYLGAPPPEEDVCGY